jgi:hypothetical protein
MKRKQSWKQVASALFEALAECDWSFWRVQEERVQNNISAAQEAYVERLLKAKKPRTKYYAIIGAHTKKVIGACVGESGKRDVLSEEPGATFKRISKKEYERCDS